MTADLPPEAQDEVFWRDYLNNPDSMQRIGRRVFSRIPSAPRCRQCGAPFTGPGGRLMRLIGKRQSSRNPNMCNTCATFMTEHHGGAEIRASLLFADIRGSTTMAERMSTAEFHALLDRFYTAASSAVFAHDGLVDKFVGDELVAVFPPMWGDRHAIHAVEAAEDLLRATGHADQGGAWAPVGAGVHTGNMWFGAVGVGDHAEITVLGDTVNTAARLASRAGAGEILVSVEAATSASLDPALEHHSLQLKGKIKGTDVVSLNIRPE
jgi:adenylate cyclase